MDPILNALKISKEEYGSLRLPHVRSREFLSMIRGTRHLAYRTSYRFGRRQPRSYGITFEGSEQEITAYTDNKLNVRIPAWYCFTESLEKIMNRKLSDKEAAAVSLMLINGSSIHEGLHVALSDFSSSMESKIQGHINADLFNHLFQVAEDLKNEANAEAANFLYTFLEAKNEIFFNEETFLKSIDKEEKEGSSPKTIAVSMVVAYKCKSRREAIHEKLKELGLEDVGKILRDAASPYVNSYEMAELLYSKLFDPSDSSMSNKKFTRENMEKASAAKAQKVMAKMLSKEEKEEMKMELEVEKGKIPSLVEIDIDKSDTGYSTFRDTSHMKFGFVKKLKISRQIVSTLSEPKKSGSKLVGTRLWRIATDQKVFAKRGESVASTQRKQPQYIILGDFSGSMKYNGLFYHVLDCLEKISNEMIEANIPHAIYGHTSIPREDRADVPVVYHIYSHRMSGKTSSNHSSRFEKASGVGTHQNYDGLAIRHVSKKFNRDTTKVLIVLCDGDPSGVYYSADEAVEDTKAAIEEARKNGIKVVVLSLREDVLKDNDFLYGEKFNVDATDQRKLESGLQRIIMG